MQDPEIKKLQTSRNESRYIAHQTGNSESWSRFRDFRNNLKRTIRKAKTNFYRTVLSSKTPKEVWKVINNILHPAPNRIRASPDDLNLHFSTTAQRTLNVNPKPVNEIKKYIESLQCNNEDRFCLRNVTYNEVYSTLKSLRNGTSTGVDNIPIKYVKLAINEICSPLTHIINSFISNDKYPTTWKQSRVCPIPKIPNPSTPTDYRPISILPALSKVYEKLVLQQMLEFIERNDIYKNTVSGFRKGFSTGSALLKLRDDIKKAMHSREISLVVLVDFSKAFDTIAHEVIITKLHEQGFSKSFLKWTLSYLSEREQFVQIDDAKSKLLPSQFGVPQGSILGPILFNLYVNDIPDIFSSKSIQYADDTTIYESGKPKDIIDVVNKINTSLNKLQNWSHENYLLTNILKTKLITCGTSNILKLHSTRLSNLNLRMGSNVIEEVNECRLLGMQLDPSLKWCNHLKLVLSSSYAKLATLRKLKNFTPFHIRKNLAESLIMSKIDFNDHVYTPLTTQQQKKLQRLQLAAASFVWRRYAKLKDVLALNWLPIPERRDFNLNKLVFKAIHNANWPVINKIEVREFQRNTRLSDELLLSPCQITGTFQNSACSSFNKLPKDIRNCNNFANFCAETKKLYLQKAMSRI